MYGQLDGGHHTYKRGYLTLPNETAWDDRLSYNALGVLAHLMARNPNGPMGYRALMRPGVGEKAILGAFKELVAAGYRMQFRRQVFKPGKRPTMVTDTYHSEDPRPLAWYEEQHIKIYGEDPIHIATVMECLEEAASKAALASPSGAHKSGALKRGARKRAAQQKAFQPLADAEENNQGEGAAVEPQEAQDRDAGQEQVHCLGCDVITPRMFLDDSGQCEHCQQQAKQERLAAAAAQEPAPDPAEVEAARLAMFQRSLERQAKKLHITVDELVAMREQAGHTSVAAVALGIKGCRSAPAHDRSEVAQK